MSPPPRSLAGQLLVSHPQLRDVHFRETVVLMHLHSSAEGALGVVVNRPLGRTLGQLGTAAASPALADIPLFEGGPVAPDRLAFGSWKFAPGLPAEARFGLGQEEAVALSRDASCELRAYVGHAGWSPGQLENELRMNAWVVCPFDADCGGFEGVGLWKRLLERHRPDLRLEAESPDDPGLN